MGNNIHYQTSDGETFYKQDDARNYAKNLKDRTIKPVAADGSGEVAETIDQSAANEIPVNNMEVIDFEKAGELLKAQESGNTGSDAGTAADTNTTDSEATQPAEDTTAEAVKEPVKKATPGGQKKPAQETKAKAKKEQPAKQKTETKTEQK